MAEVHVAERDRKLNLTFCMSKKGGTRFGVGRPTAGGDKLNQARVVTKAGI